MHVEPHLPLEELKRLEHREKDADRARRMRIVILANTRAGPLGMAVRLSRRICQRWVARYFAGRTDRTGWQGRECNCRFRRGTVSAGVWRQGLPKDSVCSAGQRLPTWPKSSTYCVRCHRCTGGAPPYSCLRPRSVFTRRTLRPTSSSGNGPTASAIFAERQAAAGRLSRNHGSAQGTAFGPSGGSRSRRFVRREYLWVLARPVPRLVMPKDWQSGVSSTYSWNASHRRSPKAIARSHEWDGAGFHTSHSLLPENVGGTVTAIQSGVRSRWQLLKRPFLEAVTPTARPWRSG